MATNFATEVFPTTADAIVRKHVATWLLLCCTLIFAMVVLGGVTRLTGSGLSIVHWKPLTGIVPPLTALQWQEEFAHYQASPEYKHINSHLTVETFKTIYWFEYAHRLLGRTIGLAFLLPFLYFALTRKLTTALTAKLVVLFILGGLQGLLGWYMVKSGLVDKPHVSQYRLTAHLLLAVLIYAYMFWIALNLLRANQADSASLRLGKLPWMAGLILLLAMVTLISGGFVAGLKAGLIFNTFPKMGDAWIPADMYVLTPFYLNWFENLISVQFNHRWLAGVTFVAVLFFWLWARSYSLPRAARRGMTLMLCMVVLQVILGISTLLLQVPVFLGALHQAGALLLLTVLLFNTYELKRLKQRV